jgi:hypothetical protein
VRAWHSGLDRPEFAADIVWRERLHIEGIDMTRSAPEEDKDTRLGPTRAPSRGLEQRLGLFQTCQRQPKAAEGADLQEPASGGVVPRCHVPSRCVAHFGDNALPSRVEGKSITWTKQTEPGNTKRAALEATRLLSCAGKAVNQVQALLAVLPQPPLQPSFCAIPACAGGPFRPPTGGAGGCG